MKIIIGMYYDSYVLLCVLFHVDNGRDDMAPHEGLPKREREVHMAFSIIYHHFLLTTRVFFPRGGVEENKQNLDNWANPGCSWEFWENYSRKTDWNQYRIWNCNVLKTKFFSKKILVKNAFPQEVMKRTPCSHASPLCNNSLKTFLFCFSKPTGRFIWIFSKQRQKQHNWVQLNKAM